jgi:predicted transcriptional regulator
MNYAELIGYINSSKYREKALDYLSKKRNTPTNIAKNTGIRVNHISKVLKELSVKGLIQCLNPEARKGRIYEITEVGRKVNKDVKKL